MTRLTVRVRLCLPQPGFRQTRPGRIGFIDRRADRGEITDRAEGRQFVASSAPMANTWQYTAAEGV